MLSRSVNISRLIVYKEDVPNVARETGQKACGVSCRLAFCGVLKFVRLGLPIRRRRTFLALIPEQRQIPAHAIVPRSKTKMDLTSQRSRSIAGNFAFLTH